MKWYEIKNKGEKAEIWIYEMIGEDFWTGGGITAKNFQKELSEIKASQIDLHINSPGGDVFDGIAIYNLIKQHPAKVTSYIDGLAASIASVIALAGDQIYMAENALFMIHNPYGMAFGEAADMRKMADLLDTVRGSIVKAYVSKTDKPDAEIFPLMDAETWMTADEAVEFGFVDEVTEKMDMAACAKFVPIMNKAGFKHVPITMAENAMRDEAQSEGGFTIPADFAKQLLKDVFKVDITAKRKKDNTKQISASKMAPTAKDAEKSLRDVGFSHKQAKVILAEGLKGYQRDVDPPVAPRDVVPAPAGHLDDRRRLLIKGEKIYPQSTAQ